ncbi:Pumilio like protein 2 [Eufriesea mexicana]|nr:Pumilio like protein 2 [Eufriesea mexicana]
MERFTEIAEYETTIRDGEKRVVSEGGRKRGEIAPSAKKLWGVDEGGSKDEGGVKGGGILHLGDHQMWRDSTWSTSDHAVSQPISMGTGRRVGVGTGYHHQTSEVGTVLSPRSSETGGLGVKMVEYVLGSSPTTPKDLEPRMVSLRLNTDPDKKEKEKGSASPFDSSKDDTGPQNNGLASQNGLDDDKGFNRTPGSRQPSPGEEEFQKNAAATLAVSAGGGGVVLLKPGVDVVGSEEHFMAAFAPAPPHHLQHHQAPPTHHLQHPHSHAAQLFGAQAPPPPQGPPPSQQQQQQQQGPPQPQDTTTHFDVQQRKKSPRWREKGEGEGVSEGDRAVFSLGLAASSRTNCLLVGWTEMAANRG